MPRISPSAFGRVTIGFPSVFSNAILTELHARLLLFSRRSIQSSFVSSPFRPVFQLIGKRQSGNRLKRISLKCNNAVPEMLLVVVFVEDSQ